MEQQTTAEIQTIPVPGTTGVPFKPTPAYIARTELTKLWQRVEKPGRYTGGEYGIPEKDLQNSEVRGGAQLPGYL